MLPRKQLWCKAQPRSKSVMMQNLTMFTLHGSGIESTFNNASVLATECSSSPSCPSSSDIALSSLRLLTLCVCILPNFRRRSTSSQSSAMMGACFTCTPDERVSAQAGYVCCVYHSRLRQGEGGVQEECEGDRCGKNGKSLKLVSNYLTLEH